MSRPDSKIDIRQSSCVFEWDLISRNSAKVSRYHNPFEKREPKNVMEPNNRRTKKSTRNQIKHQILRDSANYAYVHRVAEILLY